MELIAGGQRSGVRALHRARDGRHIFRVDQGHDTALRRLTPRCARDDQGNQRCAPAARLSRRRPHDIRRSRKLLRGCRGYSSITPTGSPNSTSIRCLSGMQGRAWLPPTA